jgi:hypothetical protein
MSLHASNFWNSRMVVRYARASCFQSPSKPEKLLCRMSAPGVNDRHDLSHDADKNIVRLGCKTQLASSRQIFVGYRREMA